MLIGRDEYSGKCRIVNTLVFIYVCILALVTPVAARSKAWVCGRWLAGIVGSNPTGDMDVLSFVNVVCCQVEVSVSG